jgi:hypothetical protein
MQDIVSGERIYCPRCEKYVTFLRISKASKIADVKRRSVYRYIEDGSVYSLKIAGKTLRVCAECLLGSNRTK